jgi:hypothetical protein
MAEKIYWKSPDDNNITQIEISRATSIYGSYSVIATISATSDTNPKSSTNTWVVSAVDSSGTKTHWYKIRMYDGVNAVWSDYSDPTTAEELIRLCTVDDIKRTIDTVGRWTDDDIFDAITMTDDLIYIECGTPLQTSVCDVGIIDTTVQDKFYVGEENIYRVDRVFYGTTTKTELYLEDGYKANNRYGMVKILPVASSGVTLATTDEVEVQYAPNIYHQLSIYRSCKYLLEQLDYTASGKPSKELLAIEKKVAMVEQLLANKVGLQLSSDVQNYDPIYGVNKRIVLQDPDRNKYIGSTGWA